MAAKGLIFHPLHFCLCGFFSNNVCLRPVPETKEKKNPNGLEISKLKQTSVSVRKLGVNQGPSSGRGLRHRSRLGYPWLPADASRSQWLPSEPGWLGSLKRYL